MKLGIIFKKEFHNKYGAKIEIFGDEITIKREFDWLKIRAGENDKRHLEYLIQAIQLIYLGEWNI